MFPTDRWWQSESPYCELALLPLGYHLVEARDSRPGEGCLKKPGDSYLQVSDPGQREAWTEEVGVDRYHAVSLY